MQVESEIHLQSHDSIQMLEGQYPLATTFPKHGDTLHPFHIVVQFL